MLALIWFYTNFGKLLKSYHYSCCMTKQQFKQLLFYQLFCTFICLAASGLFPLLVELNKTSRSVLSEVPQWHRYVYDGNSEIRDGGQDLYDNGNRVSFKHIFWVIHNGMLYTVTILLMALICKSSIHKIKLGVSIA